MGGADLGLLLERLQPLAGLAVAGALGFDLPQQLLGILEKVVFFVHLGEQVEALQLPGLERPFLDESGEEMIHSQTDVTQIRAQSGHLVRRRPVAGIVPRHPNEVLQCLARVTGLGVGGARLVDHSRLGIEARCIAQKPKRGGHPPGFAIPLELDVGLNRQLALALGLQPFRHFHGHRAAADTLGQLRGRESALRGRKHPRRPHPIACLLQNLGRALMLLERDEEHDRF